MEFARDHFTSNGYNQKREEARRIRIERKSLNEWVTCVEQQCTILWVGWPDIGDCLSAINLLSPEVDFLLQLDHSDKILRKHQIRLHFRALALWVTGE